MKSVLEVMDERDIDKYAWSIVNSQESTHPIMSKNSNKFELYDLSGNVAEWV